jgi:predicted Zn finger-like uncharacterized protein
MPLVTTCTACYAKFVVTEEQLSAHGGDVRCGKCKNVFSALASLSTVDEKSLSKALENPPEPSAETEITESNLETTPAEVIEAVMENAQSIEEESLEPDLEQAGVIDQAKEDATEIPSHSDNVTFEEEITEPALESSQAEVISETNLETHDIDTEKEMLDKPVSTILPAFSASNFNLYPPVEVATPQQEKPSIQQTYSFGDDFQAKSAKKSSVWPAVLVIVLALAAVLQSIYFLRSQLSAKYPQFQPVLAQICAQIGCKIDLPKDIGLLVIDDSDLQEDAERKGLIRLHASLINNAEYTQALPNLELTLNDADDKPLLRKIFRPQEYLAENTPLPQGIQAGDEIRISLAIVPENQKVAGYRLFIGY